MKVIENDKPLPTHTKFDVFECYAKIVLEELFPDRFSNLVILDKPDLQNEQSNIGVEVTSSINPKQKEAEALYVKLCDQGNEEREKTEKQIEKCGAKLIGGALFGITGHDDFDSIYAMIDSKTRKLGKYKSFGKYYLFIFSEIYATFSMREEALERMRHICRSESTKFNGIYILVPGALYVFDLVNNTTSEEKINSNMQFLQATRAREMVIQEEKLTR